MDASDPRLSPSRAAYGFESVESPGGSDQKCLASIRVLGADGLEPPISWGRDRVAHEGLSVATASSMKFDAPMRTPGAATAYSTANNLMRP